MWFRMKEPCFSTLATCSADRLRSTHGCNTGVGGGKRRFGTFVTSNTGLGAVAALASAFFLGLAAGALALGFKALAFASEETLFSIADDSENFSNWQRNIASAFEPRERSASSASLGKLC